MNTVRMVLKTNISSECPACTKTVFAAEEKMAGGHKWHKACFKCSTCNKRLDSTLCSEHAGVLYCKTCYSRKLGPKGYGFGGGAGTLNTDSGNQMDSAEKDEIQIDFHPGTSAQESLAQDGIGCRRCGYTVYEAERLMAAGRNWHKRCFCCLACNHHLDSTSVNDGPDGEIYCKSCHSGKFGLTGYGFGQGAGTLLSDGHSTATRHAGFTAESAFILP